jgi:hypothetical protein
VGFAQRLKKLESTLGRWPQPVSAALEKERTDEEEADALGAGLLWIQDERQADNYQSDSPFDTALRNWHAAAAVARREGHTQYHIGLRAVAMAVWLLFKPDILEDRRTYGYWIWDEPPTRVDTMPPEDFRQLNPELQGRLVREACQRRGHWSKAKPY